MTSEVLQNPYFVGLYCIYNKTDFNYKIENVLIFYYFLKGGGGGVRKENGGKKM